MPTPIDPHGAAISARLDILNAHVGTYAIDIWDDSDGSGTPSSGDKFVRRAKDFDQNQAFVDLGPASQLKNKTVRFIWGVTALGTGDDKTHVRISLSQGNQLLPGFPKELEAEFRPGQNHDVFSAFYFLS